MNHNHWILFLVFLSFFWSRNCNWCVIDINGQDNTEAYQKSLALAEQMESTGSLNSSEISPKKIKENEFWDLKIKCSYNNKSQNESFVCSSMSKTLTILYFSNAAPEESKKTVELVNDSFSIINFESKKDKSLEIIKNSPECSLEFKTSEPLNDSDTLLI